MFSGSCVALVTPFKNGSVDEKKLRELVEFHIAHKTAALVPCGTTGESATLTHQEHAHVIETVIHQARKRIPVIAGTGSNSTREAIDLTVHAEKRGADAALVIVPYYNKPTQQGIFQHFSAVANASSIPMILYNIPSRTGVNMAPKTLIQLAQKHKNIIGIKESTGQMDTITEILCGLKQKKNFTVLSGDDSLTLPILSIGGKGVISVLANISPLAVAELCALALKGHFKKAQALHLKLFPLIKALFIETNPAPIKTAMEMLNMCSGAMRLPMCALQPENKKILKKALEEAGLKGLPAQKK
jgi:4-hydroxy-tetrahydrodipicolinate synthase